MNSQTDKTDNVEYVLGRSCGTCMMCCKLPRIDELAKPQGIWCKHAKPGSGCEIYSERPELCRSFVCDWLVNPALGPEWKPDQCKFIVSAAGKTFRIFVDPKYPLVWRSEAYYPALKTFAAKLFDLGMTMIVFVGRNRYVILPDRDQELPEEVEEGAEFRIEVRNTVAGPQYDVVIVQETSSSNERLEA